MNGGRRTGWLRIGAAFWGLGAGLLLAGVAAASEAAAGGGHGGISAEKIQDLHLAHRQFCGVRRHPDQAGGQTG